MYIHTCMHTYIYIYIIDTVLSNGSVHCYHFMNIYFNQSYIMRAAALTNVTSINISIHSSLFYSFYSEYKIGREILQNIIPIANETGLNKDSGNNRRRFFVSKFHLFHHFVIFNDIDFKFSVVVDNNITFDLQQRWWLIMKNEWIITFWKAILMTKNLRRETKIFIGKIL